jgi:coenzyme PQQ precursor peptide PqqA
LKLKGKQITNGEKAGTGSPCGERVRKWWVRGQACRILQPSVDQIHLKWRRVTAVCDALFFPGVLLSSQGSAMLTERSRYRPQNDDWGILMEWTAPAFEEVCLNCEINSYASAKL